ncbi:MAG: DUF420 domain-containing protein [Planctomycetota bacterium]|mgnify:CR=1 FL=1|nr:MAG: DUF420 domain-containing protein [Planctomycetota bacterium]REJ92455.1 MAG: DUF420 domain-containing protein [Planctomycetota bacterium]REK22904.1 MAG: DUF420 domain-containing protein [Planctomycetota bacterium]REK37396.1 MAG: DUF420 domain-containing protein [Planctomycetota bacterium]
MPGFLGNRSSLMLDVVFVAMFLVLPVMAWSIYQVRFKRRYALHKRVQLLLGIVLLITVVLFEIDIRLNGWRDLAADSPYYSDDWTQGAVNWSLWVHLIFAISTCVLWVYVIFTALRHFARDPVPSSFSAKHIFWARLAAIDMTLTAITGWVFYWLAFVC